MNGIVELDDEDCEEIEFIAAGLFVSDLLVKPTQQKQVIDRNIEDSVWAKMLLDPT